MKQSPAKKQQVCAAERTIVASRIIAFLRQRHPVKMPEHVAAAIGVSAETVNQWEQRHSLPSALAISRLTLAYGPAFFAAFLGDLAPAWLDEDVREQKMNELQAKRAALDEELRSLNGR